VTFRRQLVKVDTSGPDQEGCLIFEETGALIAVLVRLSEQHEPEIVGKWFLEHGFGSLNNREHPLFDKIEQAEEWIASSICRV
jgi:hypothetical protein